MRLRCEGAHWAWACKLQQLQAEHAAVLCCAVMPSAVMCCWVLLEWCEGLQALIGGTILSWGETVPELVATYTLAKMGHSTMAIAGCFAGPVFNLMLGLGLPVLWATISQGALPMELTHGIKLLVIQSVLVLALLVTLVPLVFKWRLHQQIGLALLVVYSLFQVLFVLVEDEDVWS